MREIRRTIQVRLDVEDDHVLLTNRVEAAFTARHLHVYLTLTSTTADLLVRADDGLRYGKSRSWGEGAPEPLSVMPLRVRTLVVLGVPETRALLTGVPLCD